MKSIQKAYGPVKVLRGVDFSLQKAEIHALLGENGAGKSTLMNIVGGVVPPQAGSILIDGAEASIPSPLAAQGHGIAFIHQELTLVNDLTVAENLFLGNEPKRRGLLDRGRMRREARAILERMGIDLDPDARVSELDASYKQIVEIARALLRNARILIMDEPTTSLTEIEIRCVFEIIRAIRDQGVSVVFISHKLKEVIEICDSYTVLRDGRRIISGPVDASVDEKVLARHMVGKDLSTSDIYSERAIGEPLLQVQGYTKPGQFRNIDFTLKRGEILGFTGLLGDGRSELFLSLFGFDPTAEGTVLLEGKPVRIRSTRHAKRLGIGYVPRNRKENGIVRDLSIAQNATLAVMGKVRELFLVRRRKEKAIIDHYTRELSIKMGGSDDAIGSLSGGNQQKVVLSRWLAASPKVLILDNPTQGVDIGAKLEIYEIIMRLAGLGMSVVVLSSEAQEVLMLCDRIYVMYHGEIRREFSRAEADAEKIMIVATSGDL
jgi:ribose transport system ATP-binding protein